jgi:hypothetical protein
MLLTPAFFDLFSLLDLELRQEVDEPLEGSLVAVDPEEVDLKIGWINLLRTLTCTRTT